MNPSHDPLPPLYAPAKRHPAPPRMIRRKRRGGRRWLLGLVLALVGLPLLMVLLFKWLPLPTSAFMLQSPVKPVRYQWVPASRIADSARRAVVASEDQKFWDHHGFDVEAIQKAYQHNRRAKHRRGASTISQQTAKNLFLWSGGGYARKALEAGITVLLENLWGKDRILEVYLNIAEFGPGIYGVEAASQAYFHQPASRLSPQQAARLAAVLPNPRHWSVTAPGRYVQSRVNWIIGQMGYGGRAAPTEEPEPPATGPESDQGRSDVSEDNVDPTPPADSGAPPVEIMPPAVPEAPSEPPAAPATPEVAPAAAGG